MDYDYILAGFGLSTMLTLDAIIESGNSQNKRILIIDPDKDVQNKTWCFWEKGNGIYDALLKASWNRGWFLNGIEKAECLNGKYIYKCIDSQALHDHVRNKAGAYYITFLAAVVTGFDESWSGVNVFTDCGNYSSRYFFSSVIDPGYLDQQKYPVLLQHFEGWFIRCEDELPFASGEMTLMDFSIAQHDKTQFMYVLPLDKHNALFEHTFFTPAPLAPEDYSQVIALYVKSLGIKKFKVIRSEKGVIPMTLYPFYKKNTKRILHIGTAGGWTKASTGYTFEKSVLLARKIVQILQSSDPNFAGFLKPSRFTFYDRIFVEVLFRENHVGKKIFSGLFLKGYPTDVLAFLQEKTNLFQEFKIIMSCPKLPFLRALSRVFKK